VHYGVPDGSYATDPDGAARVFECRAMVAALNTEAGLRVVLDVVYNHTHGSGAHGRESVLDKVRARCSAEGEGEGALEEHGAGGSRVEREEAAWSGRKPRGAGGGERIHQRRKSCESDE
jgi:hypothetical protein